MELITKLENKYTRNQYIVIAKKEISQDVQD